LWHKVQQVAYNALFAENETVVAFGLAHFPGLSLFGVHFFHFFLLTILFILPFDFYFRKYPLYIFYIFWYTISSVFHNLNGKEKG